MKQEDNEDQPIQARSKKVCHDLEAARDELARSKKVCHDLEAVRDELKKETELLSFRLAVSKLMWDCHTFYWDEVKCPLMHGTRFGSCQVGTDPKFYQVPSLDTVYSLSPTHCLSVHIRVCDVVPSVCVIL